MIGKSNKTYSIFKYNKTLKTILKAEIEIIIYWYIDTAYAVQADCKSQTGVAMSMGKGIIINLSTKQKLNTNSSIENELVVVDDASYLVIWTRNFYWHNSIILKIIFSIKTIKVLFCWRKWN